MSTRALPSLLLVALPACAYTSVEPVDYTDRDRGGYRVYDPQPVLIATCDSTSIAFLPDFSRGYAVQSRAWLAKNKSAIKQNAGMVAEASTDLDSTAFLTLIQALGTEAIKSAEKLAALGEGATSGLSQSGVWRFDVDENGELTGLTPLGLVRDCAPKAAATSGATPGSAGKPRPKP